MKTTMNFKVLIMVLNFFSIFLFNIQAYAQLGTLDLTFNPKDIGFGNGEGFKGKIYSLKMSSNGKIIVSTYYSDDQTYNKKSVASIFRLNEDGTMDESFNFDANEKHSFDIGLQKDGKIVTSGYIGNKYRLARLNLNGSIDNSFQPPIFENPSDYAIFSIDKFAIQNDDKIVCFSSSGGKCELFRLNKDGSTDATFNASAKFDNTISFMEIQQDNKILVGGYFTLFNGSSRRYIARLDPDGFIDPTFNVGYGFDSPPEYFEMQQDEKIIISGNFRSFNGDSFAYGEQPIVRIDQNGKRDSKFKLSKKLDYTITLIASLPNNQILIGGGHNNSLGIVESTIERFDTNGNVDLTFNDHGGFWAGYPSQLLTQPSGRIIIGGNFNSYSDISKWSSLVGIEPSGIIDASFCPVTGFSAPPQGIVNYSDGKLLAFGGGNFYNGNLVNGLVRLNYDGSLDATFSFSQPKFHINSILLQSDGKIIVGGASNSKYPNILRLNSNGSIDESFNYPDAQDEIFCLGLMKNNQVIVAKKSTIKYYSDIIKLNSDGSIDFSFSPNYPWEKINSINIQSDQKILVLGDFTENLIRLNSDGTRDYYFVSAFSTIQKVNLLDDDRIAIVYNVPPFNVISKMSILLKDGSLDNSFDFTTDIDVNDAKSCSVTAYDDKLLFSGEYIENASYSKKFLLINKNGSIDFSFPNNIFSNNGYSANINNILITLGKKIIITGYFTSINEIGRNNIARLNGIFATNKLPIANAGLDQTVNEGSNVTLDGSLSSDPDNDLLTYIWTAPSGIILSSNTSQKPKFIAPQVSTNTDYIFSLVVNDGKVDSPADHVVITVIPEVVTCPLDANYDEEPNGAAEGTHIGQSVTAIHTGILNKVKFQVWPNGNPYLVLRKWVSDIYEQAFDGEIIATSNIATNMPSISNWIEMSTFQFSSQTQLIAGHKYVLEVINGKPYVKHGGAYQGGMAYETLNPLSVKDMRFALYVCPDISDNLEIQNFGNQIKIYPNPTTGLVYFDFSQKANGKIMVSILSITGSEVLKQEFDPGLHSQLDISSLPNGIYFAKLSFGHQQLVHKIILKKNK